MDRRTEIDRTSDRKRADREKHIQKGTPDKGTNETDRRIREKIRKKEINGEQRNV